MQRPDSSKHDARASEPLALHWLSVYSVYGAFYDILCTSMSAFSVPTRDCTSVLHRDLSDVESQETGHMLQ